MSEQGLSSFLDTPENVLRCIISFVLPREGPFPDCLALVCTKLKEATYTHPVITQSWTLVVHPSSTTDGRTLQLGGRRKEHRRAVLMKGLGALDRAFPFARMERVHLSSQTTMSEAKAVLESTRNAVRTLTIDNCNFLFHNLSFSVAAHALRSGPLDIAEPMSPLEYDDSEAEFDDQQWGSAGGPGAVPGGAMGAGPRPSGGALMFRRVTQNDLERQPSAVKVAGDLSDAKRPFDEDSKSDSFSASEEKSLRPGGTARGLQFIAVRGDDLERRPSQVVLSKEVTRELQLDMTQTQPVTGQQKSTPASTSTPSAASASALASAFDDRKSKEGKDDLSEDESFDGDVEDEPVHNPNRPFADALQFGSLTLGETRRASNTVPSGGVHVNPSVAFPPIMPQCEQLKLVLDHPWNEKEVNLLDKFPALAYLQVEVAHESHLPKLELFMNSERVANSLCIVALRLICYESGGVASGMSPLQEYPSVGGEAGDEDDDEEDEEADLVTLKLPPNVQVLSVTRAHGVEVKVDVGACRRLRVLTLGGNAEHALTVPLTELRSVAPDLTLVTAAGYENVKELPLDALAQQKVQVFHAKGRKKRKKQEQPEEETKARGYQVGAPSSRAVASLLGGRGKQVLERMQRAHDRDALKKIFGHA